MKKRKMKVSGMIIAAVCLFGGGHIALADSSSGAGGNVGGNMPTPDRVPQDKRTDLTEGKQAVPDEYATTPVRQGSLKEVKDSKWLNKTVTNKDGEQLGKVTKILKDEKTQDIEYAFLEMTDSRHAMPMRWSRFQQQGDKLMLNVKKDDLLPNIDHTDSKDMSPDLAMFMEEIEQKRDEPKPKVGPGDGRGTNRPAPSAGPMGEERSSGNLGPRGAPPTEAPQFEGEGQRKHE
jgi:sporulation protein YlmC with PRC-barrel domain